MVRFSSSACAARFLAQRVGGPPTCSSACAARPPARLAISQSRTCTETNARIGPHVSISAVETQELFDVVVSSLFFFYQGSPAEYINSIGGGMMKAKYIAPVKLAGLVVNVAKLHPRAIYYDYTNVMALLVKASRVKVTIHFNPLMPQADIVKLCVQQTRMKLYNQANWFMYLLRMYTRDVRTRDSAPCCGMRLVAAPEPRPTLCACRRRSVRPAASVGGAHALACHSHMRLLGAPSTHALARP